MTERREDRVHPVRILSPAEATASVQEHRDSPAQDLRVLRAALADRRQQALPSAVITPALAASSRAASAATAALVAITASALTVALVASAVSSRAAQRDRTIIITRAAALERIRRRQFTEVSRIPSSLR